MNGFVQVLRELGAVRLAVMSLVAVGVIAFFMFMASRFGQSSMGLLYGELELEDSAAIVTKLESMNVPFEVRADGAQVRVPEDQIQRLRMTMAQDGLPSGGSLGYEIFDRSNSIGATSFVQNVNLVRALEGELRRSIATIKQIKNARVHLVLPKREVFQRKNQEPSASVIVEMRGGGVLERGQVIAIQNLVSAAVPRLKPGRISIVDTNGNLLARGGNVEEGPGVTQGRLQEMQASHERRIENAIQSLLERTVGPGKVRAEVTAEIDFDRTTTNSETYDPDGQVVRSSQLVEESSRSSETEGEGTVTVQNNLPEAEAADDGANNESNSSNARTEETTNYEISKTIKTEVREAGVIRRLSVAVLVDGNYTADDQGRKTYQPRSDEELKALTALVESATGFDADRGDKVQVVNLRFAEVDAEFEETAVADLFFGLSKTDLFKIAEMVVLGLVGIMVLLLIVRPMLNRLLNAERAPAPVGALAGGGVMQLPGVSGEESVPLPSGQTVVAGALPPAGAHAGPMATDNGIDVDAVGDQVKATSIRKVGEIVDKHPDEAVAIMRSWLYEEN